MIHITTHTDADTIYWVVARNGNATLSRKAIRLASGHPIRSEEHLISDLCEEVLRLQQELAAALTPAD